MAGSDVNLCQPDDFLGLEQLLRIDPNRPFANTQDAVERLLPLHLLASTDAVEADDLPNKGEVMPLARHPTQSRLDAWNESQLLTFKDLQRVLASLDEEVTAAKTHACSVKGVGAYDNMTISSQRAVRAQEQLAELQRQRQLQIKAAGEKRSAEAQLAAASVIPESLHDSGLLQPNIGN